MRLVILRLGSRTVCSCSYSASAARAAPPAPRPAAARSGPARQHRAPAAITCSTVDTRNVTIT